MREVWLQAAQSPLKLPGVLAGYELPGMLTQLMRKKVSGRLTLTVGEAERTIQFMQGVISSVASKDPKEHLVNRFSGRNKLNKEQSAAVQDLMQKENLRFGAALVKLKLVDAQMFAGMLAEHHAYILARCIQAKAVRCELDTHAKGPADRAPLHFLEAVEKALAKLPMGERSSLNHTLHPLVLTLSKDDTALLHRMDPSAVAQRIVQASSPEGVKADALVDQAGGTKARAALHALFLCGLLKPTPASLTIIPKRVWPYVAIAGLSFAAGAASMFFGMRAMAPTPEPVLANTPVAVAAPTPTPASQPASLAIEDKAPAPAPSPAPVAKKKKK